jgi:DNA replication protein DnaC
MERLGDTLKQELEKLGLGMDPDLKKELAKYSDPDAPVRYRCAGDCNVVVPKRGSYCESCTTRINQEHRVNALSIARASLPQWSWCRFGDPQFGKCTRKAQPAAQAAAAWHLDAGNLVLLGPTRAGKTVSAVALGYKLLELAEAADADPELVRFAVGLRFTVGRDLANARRFAPLGEGDAPAVIEAQEATLLVLDEVGFENQDTAVFEVMDLRYRASKPTILTSGLTKRAFVDRYGAALLGRLSELGEIVDLHARSR